MELIKVRHPEDNLCAAFCSMIDALKAAGKQNQEFVICHVANENPGGTKQQRMLRGSQRKKIGVKKGALDYIVGWGDGQHAWMEAKRKKGQYGATSDGYCTPDQKEFIRRLDSMNIPNKVFKTVDEGIGFLVDLGLLKE